MRDPRTTTLKCCFFLGTHLQAQRSLRGDGRRASTEPVSRCAGCAAQVWESPRALLARSAG
eukprot:5278743-Alexandrium_andersonii.AAC.1